MATVKHRELFDDMKKAALEQVQNLEGNFKSSHNGCVSMVSEQTRSFVNESVETQIINDGDTEEGIVDVETTVRVDPDNFRIEVNVQQFARKEVSVKVTGNYITVEGKHEEKRENSSASRKFSRQFTLPDGYDVSGLTPTISDKGILVITAPKISMDKSKEIIVTQTGRVGLEARPEQLKQLKSEFTGSSASSITSEESYRSSSECFQKQNTRNIDKEESFVDVQSRVYMDKEHFSVEIYVQEFTSQEISITVSGDCVTVEGNHEEKQENRSLVRKFLKKYIVPEGYNVSALVPTFSTPKKLLTLTAPKVSTKCRYCTKNNLQTEQDLLESSSTKTISETHSSNECSQTQINTIDNEEMDNVDDIETTVRIDKDNFRIDLDVQQFTPQEISIKIAGDCVTVKGNHEDRQQSKFSHRRFTRKYRVPQGYDVRGIISTYSSSKKVLTLTVPRVSTSESKEVIIPITQTKFNATNKQEVEEELKQSSISVSKDTNRCLTECFQSQKPSTSNKGIVDIKSTVQIDEQTFHIELDVHEFTAEEISTKVLDGCVIIEGCHEEKQENKSVSRKFVKNYTIPEVFDSNKLESTLSKGIMTITAPKKVSKETLIPIAKPEIPITTGQQKKEGIQESSSAAVSEKSQFVNECYQTKSTNIIEKKEINSRSMAKVQQNEQSIKSVSQNNFQSPPALTEMLGSVNESFQPRKNITVKQETEDVVVEHTLYVDTNHFRVSLNVEEFTPQEITVKTSDDCVIIEGIHENQNCVSKKFLKKITVPQGFDVTAIDATFSKKGVLVLSAPRISTDLNTLEEISGRSHHFTNECFKTKQTKSIDEESSVHIDQDQFRVELNLQQSTPQDISVKANEDCITIEGNQRDQEKFIRKFKLPPGYDITALSPTFSPDGLLTITIPKISANLSVSEASKMNLRDFDGLKPREIKTDNKFTCSSKKTVEKESSFHIGEDFIRVDLDVQQFTPQEISIKVSGDCLIIECNHEEKQGQTTSFKKFSREYTLPQGYDVNALVPTFSSDGVLTLTIPKTSTNVPTVESNDESCSSLTDHTQKKSSDREFTLRLNKDSFRVDLNVHQFKLQHISVKVFDECITVEGKDETQDTENLFKKYTIPEGYDVSAVVPSFSPDGILTLTVPKASTDSHSEFLKQNSFVDKIFKTHTTKNTEDFTVHADDDSFSVDIDVQQYTPEEISVKVSGDCVTIEAIHKENQGNSSISKKFLRTYTVPQGFDIAALSSSLSPNGMLTLTAPKITKTTQEKIIPLTRTGESVIEDQN